ncbi:MAG: site-specific integrase, partial [Planctomycetota bacterium]
MSKRISCATRHRQRRLRGGKAVAEVGLDPSKYLTHEQVMTVLDYCRQKAQGGGYRATVTLMLIETYIYTGLRAIEGLGLQIRDLPGFNGHPDILRVPAEFAKGHKQRTIRVSPKIVEKWQRFITEYHKPALALISSGDPKKKAKGMRTPLFINERGKPIEYHGLYQRCRTVARHTGVKIRPHMLRHTYGSQLYAKRADLRFVQDQLGHTSPQVTSIYARTLNPSGQQQ